MKTSRLTLPFSLKRHTRAHLISLGLGSSLLFGCFDQSDGGDGESAEPLTHESAHALLTTNIQSTSSSLEERLRFLDGDERLMEAFNTLFGGGEDESCYFDYDDEGNAIYSEYEQKIYTPCDCIY